MEKTGTDDVGNAPETWALAGGQTVGKESSVLHSSVCLVMGKLKGTEPTSSVVSGPGQSSTPYFGRTAEGVYVDG